MNQTIHPGRRAFRGAGRALLVALLSALCLGRSSLAAAEPAAGASRADVAVSLTDKWSILQRPAGKEAWQPVSPKQKLPAEDLLLGLPGGMLEAANGAVRLTFRTDLSGTSPYPVVESAVLLHENAKVDLDLTLDRGRIDLANHKEKGAAHVRVRVRDATWDLLLEGPQSRIALELYGRWPRGATFTKEPGPKDVPTASLIFLVLQGEVSLKHGDFEYPLKAPPGPALMEWNSTAGQDEAPRKLDKLPPWAEPAVDDTALAREKKARLAKFVRIADTKSLDEAIDEFLASDDAAERKLAVMALCALDELQRLGKLLRETKHHDVWDNGIVALRHWIGRGPGQDQVLYKRLVDAGLPEVEAETVVQLLHSFGDEDLTRPETYRTLIAYLNHDRLAIRGLAYWHLVRLVPAGKEFGYNPWDDKETRTAAVQKWKKLIPTGKLPPKPEVKEPPE